ncbi:MAG: hypothetical protein FWG20_04330, partial [Candidatus Cloacimonetes bacterium]|nr:hypothetical protein [Candidatus Cloacimonadota bacterium]
SVWVGQIPPKNEDGNAPCIIVRYIGDEIKIIEGGARVKEAEISFFCGVYAHDTEATFDVSHAYPDILNMMDRVQIVLFSSDYYDQNFWYIIDPIKTTIGLEKAIGVYEAGLLNRPFYGCAITAFFRTAAMQRNPIPGITDTIER